MTLAWVNMRGRAVLGAAIVGLAGCGTPLPTWDPHHLDGADSGASVDAAGEPYLVFDPPATPEAVTRVTRIEVELARPVASPRVLLVEGTLTAAQVRDLARPTVTQALSARVQPALVWTSSETALVVAPLASLVAGTVYSVGISDPPTSLSFTVAVDDGRPLLPRVWPGPEDVALPAMAAVWCGRDALAVSEQAVTLAPGAIAGRLAPGTGSNVTAAKCLSWFPLRPAVASPSTTRPALTPAWVPLADGAMLLLEPTLLWPDTDLPDPASAACGPSEVRFGPGCATVDDDRIVVRPPAGPVLWTIATGAETVVRRSRAERPFVVRPLPADARVHFAVIDERGRSVEHTSIVRPAPPRAHVVISEVMANPAGIERAQEWVELYNDGLFPVAIGGYGLETGGGIAVLPAGVLGPGAFALVITDAYEDDDGVDPVAAPGTLFLRVPALGRDGLSNEGERLSLRDAGGAILSTFPAMKAKNGISNARLAPDVLDADLDGFAPSSNGSATPGAANGPP
jgi:hypothetical protein